LKLDSHRQIVLPEAEDRVGDGFAVRTVTTTDAMCREAS
jgi:hypothetical protein